MMAALRAVVFGTALGNSSTRRARLTADTYTQQTCVKQITTEPVDGAGSNNGCPLFPEVIVFGQIMSGVFGTTHRSVCV